MKVLKFGGSSVKNAHAMREVALILKKYKLPLLVVLSATEGTTDTLLQMVECASKGEMEELTKLRHEMENRHLQMIKELGLSENLALKREISAFLSKLEIILIGIFYLREATARARDEVAAHGELLSTLIFSYYLSHLNIKNYWLDVRKVLITDDQFGKAMPDLKESQKRIKKKVLPLLSRGMVITQGFIGATPENLTTTLGRGGSDFSAALFGSILNAEVIEIWTDVSGIKTADPRVVPKAYTQKDMSFKEAAELAYFGAKVLHPSTLLPAMGKNIPVLVKNTMAPEDLGTIITSQSIRPGIIKALAFRKDIVVMTIESTRMLMAYGFLEKIFDVFARYKIAVDLISTSEISVSLTIDKSQYDPAIVKELSAFALVNVSDKQSIISLVGENIKSYPNFLKKTFQVLDSTKVEMISFGASNVNLSIVTDQSYTNEAVLQLHKIFFEN